MRVHPSALNTKIIPQPLQKLLNHSTFKRRLFQLGANARQKTESSFTVEIDPSSPGQHILTDVKMGITSRCSPGDWFIDSLSDIQRVVHIHNHPCYHNKNYPTWNEFFSDKDIEGFCDMVSGLVFVPNKRPALILLLAQFESYPSLADFTQIGGTAYKKFLSAMKKARTSQKEIAWMQAAIAGLNEVGIRAAAKLYPFPVSPELPSPLRGRSVGDFKGFDISLKQYEFQMEKPVAQQQNEGPKTDIPPPPKEYRGFTDQGLPPKGFESVGAWIYENTGIQGYFRKEFIVELIKRGMIRNPHYGQLCGFWASPEDMAGLTGKQFFTADDMAVKLDTDLETIRANIIAGVLRPDFILMAKGRKEYVFLSVPKVHLRTPRDLKPWLMYVRDLMSGARKN